VIAEALGVERVDADADPVEAAGDEVVHHVAQQHAVAVMATWRTPGPP
jgi:hypothetical protein